MTCGVSGERVTSKSAQELNMYVSWRRQITLDESKRIERVAAKVAREIMFLRAGYSASIPTWAKRVAHDESINIREVRAALVKILAKE